MAVQPTSPLLVIAAAGLGSRFRNAGYSQPKPCIEFQGRPLLEWSLVGLEFAHDMEIRVVVQRRDRLADFTRESCAAVGLPEPAMIELDSPTDGQASTVLRALEESDRHRPLIIWNVDTHLRPGSLSTVPEGNWLHLFPSDSPSMSYAQVDQGRVVRVAEKVVISGWASSGLYGFASCAQFRDVSTRTATADPGPASHERFVAPLYQFLIEDGESVFPVFGSTADVVPLGTPEDLARVRRRLLGGPSI